MSVGCFSCCTLRRPPSGLDFLPLFLLGFFLELNDFALIFARIKAEALVSDGVLKVERMRVGRESLSSQCAKDAWTLTRVGITTPVEDRAERSGNICGRLVVLPR